LWFWLLLQKLSHRAQQLLDFIKVFDNWYARILEFFELYPNKLVKYRAKNGLIYFVRQKSSDAGNLIDCLGSRGYFRYFGIEKQDTIIDIGANIGGFTVYAAAAASEGKVYSFEPVEDNFLMLEKNVKANKLQNVKTSRLAVLERPKRARMFLAKTNGSHSIIPMNESRGQTIVQATSLEQILKSNSIKKCDFLKMDCEGAEYQIVCECSKKVLDRIENIVLEFHDSDNRDHKQIKNHLERNGFKTLVSGELPGKKRGMIYATKGLQGFGVE